MTARYFLIGETGDAGAWLVDVQQKTVDRIDSSVLAGGADMPDGDLVANLTELRGDRNFVAMQGVNLAIAADSRAELSAHNRREGGVDRAVAIESRGGLSAHNRREGGVDLAVAVDSRGGLSAHNRREGSHDLSAVKGVDFAIAADSRTGLAAHNRREGGN